MATLTKKVKPVNWKHFTETALQKISENIQDMIVTVATLGMLLAYLFLTQPLAAIEYSGYIISLFIGFMFLRIVQDFDESWTQDEIGDRIADIDNKLDDITRMVRNETGEGVTIDERVANLEEGLAQLHKVSDDIQI